MLDWQELDAHLREVADIAAGFARKFQSTDWAWNAGWLHDLGKAADEFQSYLIRQNGLDDPDYDGGSGRVNHSSAGAAYAEVNFGLIAGRTLAYLAAGHHAGLPDFFPTDSANAALQVRLLEGKGNLERIRERIEIFRSCLHSNLRPPAFLNSDGYHLWVRMLFSCLVDADSLDTEAFLNPLQAENRSGFPTLAELKHGFDTHMGILVSRSQKTPVNDVRQEVLADCRSAANTRPGLFTLTVPTGGGKTLASMAFAIGHALKHGKERIIYVIPYTSIIEQTSSVFADVFGRKNVVEHHSNLDPDNETPRSQLASENWDAPIIVTTNVQFFESLFAAKRSRCRKLHNIVNSVVILDEVQLLPPKLLTPCVDALNRLARDYGVTMVLATATQPALPGLDNPKEIIKEPGALYSKLKRTEISMPADFSLPASWADVAKEIAQYDQALCVVNSRRDCFDLFNLMPEGTIHLSALMCGEHRTEAIQKIKKKLMNGSPVRVISTQLVEAGVDIDFPVVFRALCGLDSIAQSAGRCNREGRMNLEGRIGMVRVFIPPKPAPAGLLRKGEDTTREMAVSQEFNAQDPEQYIKFFQTFYSRVNDTGADWLRDRFVKDVLSPDGPSVHFRTAGQEFSLIDDQAQRPVFVRFGESVRWLDELRRIGPSRVGLRRLQRYSVNLSHRVFFEATGKGLVEEVWPGFWCWIGAYSTVHGLDLFGPGWAVEDLVV